MAPDLSRALLVSAGGFIRCESQQHDNEERNQEDRGEDAQEAPGGDQHPSMRRHQEIEVRHDFLFF